MDSALDVIEGHSETLAFGTPSGHSSEQVGPQRRDPRFAQQSIAEKRDTFEVGSRFHKWFMQH